MQTKNHKLKILLIQIPWILTPFYFVQPHTGVYTHIHEKEINIKCVVYIHKKKLNKTYVYNMRCTIKLEFFPLIRYSFKHFPSTKNQQRKEVQCTYCVNKLFSIQHTYLLPI